MSKRKSSSIKYQKKRIKQTRLQSSKKEVDVLLNGTEKKGKNKTKTKIYIPNFLKAIGAVFGIALIALISKRIIRLEESPIIHVFSNREETVKLEKDYELKVGITHLDTNDMLASKNIILKELEKLTSVQLVSMNQDNSLTYLAAKEIIKLSNKEYQVTLNDKYQINPKDLIATIQSLKDAGESTIYQKNVSQIQSVEQVNKNQIKITLERENPYFIYDLDFPIRSENTKKVSQYRLENQEPSMVSLIRENSQGNISKINVSSYEDTDKMVEHFRNNELDVFFASSNNAMQLIGKHEYNVKKYRDGETVFILGNKNSELYARKEVRQAIAYSLDREKIVKTVNQTYAEVIDLPYIYSNIQYKYDIYGAQNTLLASGWKKGEDGIYIKQQEDGTKRLILTLLVNQEDEEKN